MRTARVRNRPIGLDTEVGASAERHPPTSTGPSFRNSRSGSVERVGESLRVAGIRAVQVGIAGDEQIGPAVAVDVADRGAAVPPEGTRTRRHVQRHIVDETLAGLVPQQHVVALGRHVEIGPAVEVEVGRHAPVAARLDPRTDVVGDVDEPSAVVAVQAARGQLAHLAAPRAPLAVRPGVDDVQVEPAVAVVVDPTQPPPIIAAGSGPASQRNAPWRKSSPTSRATSTKRTDAIDAAVGRSLSAPPATAASSPPTRRRRGP